jgi:hypothetical protein
MNANAVLGSYSRKHEQSYHATISYMMEKGQEVLQLHSILFKFPTSFSLENVFLSNLSSKLVEMDRSSLPIEVEEGLGRRSAVAEAILWDEQETEIIMFAISCLLLANYKSLQL